jgi:hypothetical protein
MQRKMGENNQEQNYTNNELWYYFMAAKYGHPNKRAEDIRPPE